MVEQSEGLDEVFAALSDPTRRAILARLRGRDASVSELAEPFAISLAGVSKHLDVLERAGLVHRIARGRERRCHLDPRPLRAVAAFAADYRRFWEGRLDALEALLAEEEKKR